MMKVKIIALTGKCSEGIVAFRHQLLAINIAIYITGKSLHEGTKKHHTIFPVFVNTGNMVRCEKVDSTT